MRNELLDKLNVAMEKIYPIAREKGYDVAVFLNQSIAANADEGTLEKIIADIEKFAEKWSKE